MGHGDGARHMGPQRLAFLYISSVLGAGILIVPGHTVNASGSASVLVWLGLGGVCVAIASLFASISAAFPRASGIQEVIGRGLGPSLSRYTTGVLIAVYCVGNPAMGIASAQYLAVVLDEPALGTQTGSAVLGMAFMVLSVVVSGLPPSVVSAVQAWSMRAALVVLAVAGVTALPDLSWQHVVDRGPADLSGIAAAAGIAFYAYLGWENVSMLAAQVDDPGRTFRIAIRRAVPVVVIVYFLAVVAYAALPTNSSPLLVPALTAGLPDPVRVPLLLASLLAIVAATNAWVLGGSSLVADTLARLGSRSADGRRLGLTSRGLLLGGYAAVLTGAASGVLVIDQLLVWTSCLFLSVYALAAVAFIRVRRTASVAAVTVLAAAVAILLSNGSIGAVLATCTVLAVVIERFHRVRSVRPHHDHRPSRRD